MSNPARWMNEKTMEALRYNWKAGKSTQEIAKIISHMVGYEVTKNAIVGRAHRIGLSGRPSPIEFSATRKADKALDAAQKDAAIPLLAAGYSPKVVAEKTGAPEWKMYTLRQKIAAEPPDLRRRENKDVVQSPVAPVVVAPPPVVVDVPRPTRAPRTCMWPIGHPGSKDFKFCCEEAMRPPYCEEHRALAYKRRTVDAY